MASYKLTCLAVLLVLGCIVHESLQKKKGSGSSSDSSDSSDSSSGGKSGKGSSEEETDDSVIAPTCYKLDLNRFGGPRPKWIKGTVFTGIGSVSSCASKAYNEDPITTIGYLFNSGSGWCTGILGVRTDESEGATDITSSDGDLYLEEELICPDQFTLYAVDNGFVCWRFEIETELKYADAGDTCNSWSNSNLATVKTTEKLELAVSLAPEIRLWIGLDDLAVEGQYVYSYDGSVMTADQISALYMEDQPDDQDDNEDCVIIHSSGALNDITCSSSRGFLCEIFL